MASIEELAKEKARLYDQAPDRLATSAEKVQRKLWRQLLPIITSLETDADGIIIQSDDNINRISTIVNALDELLVGDEYKQAVKSFLGDIDKNVILTDEIARSIDKGFEPDRTQRRILDLVRRNAVDALIGDGLRGRVSQPFQQQLIANIVSGATLRDTVISLQTVIEGDDNVDGRIAANVKTTASTAQSVADRSYAASVYDNLGVEYFRYVGGEIPTTRDFCDHRESDVFHKKEIEKWGAGENTIGFNDIVDGTWDGRISGTNSRSIFTNLGGWNCRHSLVPVTGSRVPDSVIARAKEQGFT